MEGVEGMFKSLKLSSEEKKSIKVGGGGMEGSGSASPVQAVAKLFSERGVRPEAIEQSVGWIWCPAKGISCKDVGDNTFLISFNQFSGLRKALDDGPWTISKELLVVAEFDESKSLDEIEFSSVPIWMRVERLPMGLMNRAAAKVIGDDVGEFMEVDSGGGVSAVGRVLRLKIRLDIRKPLQRGIMADLGSEKGERWCPITYEHLPEFCYICGLIGHVDRSCSKKLGKEEPAPYSRELRFVPPRRPGGGGGPRLTDGYHGGSSGRSGGSGSWRGRADSWGFGGKSRSDGSSWMKDVIQGKEKGLEEKVEDGEEVLSPMKVIKETDHGSGQAKKELFPSVTPNKSTALTVHGEDRSMLYVNSPMQQGHVLPDGVEEVRGQKKVKETEMEKEKPCRKFRRAKRVEQKGVGERSPGVQQKKRRGDELLDMELDGNHESKRSRVDGTGEQQVEGSVFDDAGLSKQPCESQ